jgi:hypothetical protein
MVDRIIDNQFGLYEVRNVDEVLVSIIESRLNWCHDIQQWS